MLLVLLAWLGVVHIALGADPTLGAESSRGREILESRHCLECHTLNHSGAGVAPDLARRSVAEEHTPSELAALMWNHGPKMWRMMEASSLEVEPLSRSEADDLFAYFWSLRYFDPRGEAVRGKELFARKQCASCHDVTPQPGDSGQAPPVSEWSGLKDAVLWAQELWNHADAMKQRMEDSGLKWPEFSEQEMVDLLIYLQNLPSMEGDPCRLDVAETGNGRRVFAAKRCASCHTLDPPDPGKTALAGELRDFNTLSGFTAAMWNHAHELRAPSTESSSTGVTFSTEEMQDLVSYLYFNGGFEEGGDVDAGRKVFTAAGCQSCHGVTTAGSPAIPISGSMSAARMASAVWSHGPRMLEEMERKGVAWPTLTSRQMANLVAFLDVRGNAPR